MRHRKQRHTRGSLTRSVSLSLVLAAMLSPGAMTFAQEAQSPTVTPEPTPVPEPEVIAATEIPDQAAATARFLREAVARARVGDEVEEMEELYAQEKVHVAALEEETRRRLEIDGPASVLEETEKAWQRGNARLGGWLLELKERGEAIDRVLAQLATEKSVWELTSSSEREVDLPPEVNGLVDETLEAVKKANRDVRSDRDAILTLQSRITKTNGLVDELLALRQ